MNDINNLLTEVKEYLNYTWEDANRDNRLVGYIRSSIEYIKEVANAEVDIEKDYLAKDLFLNRVLYMNSQALDDFAKNYNSYLNELRIKYDNYDTEN